MATYFVRPTNGSDAADGLTFANAFQTFQKALDTAAVAGDIIRLIPEATETTAVTVDVDTNSGTTINPITIEPGNTTDGARDISLTYTLQASSSMTGLLEFGSTQDGYRIFNLKLDANSNATHALFNNADGSDNNSFFDCEFTGATGHGVNLRGTILFWTMINCECHANGGYGYNNAGANRGNYYINGGSSHDNTSGGLNVNRTTCIFKRMEVYDNGGDGFTLNSSSNGTAIEDCTIQGNTGDGIEFFNNTGRDELVISGNSCSGNGGFGFNFNGGGDTDVTTFMDYNHTFNNTSGASDLTLPGDNNVTGDPLFTSIVDGSEDFVPLSGSPLIGAGLMGKAIGARAAAAGGGGGGVGKIAGQGGGLAG